MEVCIKVFRSGLLLLVRVDDQVFANCVQSVYTLLMMFHFELKYLLVKRTEHDDSVCRKYLCVRTYVNMTILIL